MIWDIANPFVMDIKVVYQDIDELDHVNNAVYVKWLEQCAWCHSDSLGINLEMYKKLKRAMVVMRHEIDYLLGARIDDELQLGTWIVEMDQRLKIIRQFQLINPLTQTTILRAKTIFCCVDMVSGKPKRMPPEFIQYYGAVALNLV